MRRIPLREWFAVLLLIGFGTANIVSTYSQLSHIYDEAPHVGTGMEWWQKHSYTLEPLHPPFVRVMAAALPFFYGKGHVLDDAPSDQPSAQWYQGAAVLYADNSYVFNLTLARLGVLPFYLISCLLVFVWSRDLFGPRAALLSLALYVTLPPVAAHAGLAATDVGYMAMLLWAIWAGIGWLKQPTRARSVMLGVSAALMVGSKYSAFVQFPGAMLLIIAGNYLIPDGRVFTITRRHFINKFALVLPVFCVVLAAVFQFSWEPFAQGVHDIYEKNHTGHATWLFHALNNKGVWYFFPVVLFFKTPLSFIISHLLSLWRCVSEVARRQIHCERLFPFLAAVGTLIPNMLSDINIGVRHALPVYPLLAIPAGYALAGLWQKNQMWQCVVLVLVGWQTWNFVESGPDRLTYYNETASIITDGHPERISPDSDFEWGQEFLQLGEAVRRNHIDRLYGCFFLGGSIRRLDVDLGVPYGGCPPGPGIGWLAVEKVERVYNPEKYRWLDGFRPVETVGTTIELYHFEDPNAHW